MKNNTELSLGKAFLEEAKVVFILPFALICLGILGCFFSCGEYIASLFVKDETGELSQHAE